jgi:hypothetical protein
MSDDSLYNYDLKKTMMPGFLTKGVRIRDSWVSRCKRYLGKSGCDLNRLVHFIKLGLYDRRVEGFQEKALDAKLSVAQQWLLLHLVLKDGIPEWVRDESLDEDAPEMKVAEPVVDSNIKAAAKSAVNMGMKPVTGFSNLMKSTPEQTEEPTKEVKE